MSPSFTAVHYQGDTQKDEESVFGIAPELDIKDKMQLRSKVNERKKKRKKKEKRKKRKKKKNNKSKKLFSISFYLQLNRSWTYLLEYSLSGLQ